MAKSNRASRADKYKDFLQPTKHKNPPFTSKTNNTENTPTASVDSKLSFSQQNAANVSESKQQAAQISKLPENESELEQQINDAKARETKETSNAVSLQTKNKSVVVVPDDDIHGPTNPPANTSITANELASNNGPSDTVPVNNNFVCNACLEVFHSKDDVIRHMAVAHSSNADITTTNSLVQEASRDFIKVWDINNVTSLRSREVVFAASSNFLSKSPPNFCPFDQGLSSSFQLTPVVPSLHLPEILSYAWLDEQYDIKTPIPGGSVVRIQLKTNHATVSEDPRTVNVTVLPAIESNVDMFRNVLADPGTANSYNPLWVKPNMVIVSLKVVLANLYVNQSTSYSQDFTPATENRLLRIVPGHEQEWWPMMYPRRTLSQNVSKTSEFVEGTLSERTGRMARSQIFQGANTAWTDVGEFSDNMTVFIRDLWLSKMIGCHAEPDRLALALTNSTKIVSFTTNMALTVPTLSPWIASQDDRKLTQVLDIARLCNSPARAQAILSSAAQTLQACSVLQIDPTILADSMSSVVESTTQSVSPAALFLQMLSKSTADASAFWSCLASWMYNGILTTCLRDEDYPAPTAMITDFKSLWQALICSIVSPLTNDPNAPCKVFMIMASMLDGIEGLPLDNPLMKQTTPVWNFNNPSKWPRCFRNPNQINPRQSPLLHEWALLIHHHWPTPSQLPFGAPDELGSTNVFIEDGQLVFPYPNEPMDWSYPTMDRQNASYRWTTECCKFFQRILRSETWASRANSQTRQAALSVIMQLQTSKSMTHGFLQKYAPHEMTIIAGALAFPPFQVPYVRMNADQITIQVGVRRNRLQNEVEPVTDLSSTHESVGIVINVDAKSLAVALLSGTIDPTTLPSVHYGNVIAPLYNDQDFFAPHQRAVIVAEAYQVMQQIMSQISDTREPRPDPLNWIQGPNASSATAAQVATEVERLFAENFDMKDEILAGIVGYGDPRFTSVQIARVMHNGRCQIFNPVATPSAIVQSMNVVQGFMTREPNLFGIGTGDIVLEMMHTSAGFSGLNAPGNLEWNVGDPDVQEAGDRLILISGQNGAEPRILDRNGVGRPLSGRWVISMNTWRVSNAVVMNAILPRIQTGKMAVRLTMSCFPFVLYYYKPEVGVNEWNMIAEWAKNCTPEGMPPIPFSSPTPTGFNTLTPLCVRYIRCINYNEGSLFVTNSDLPMTIYGPNKDIDSARWRILCDRNADVDDRNLQGPIELYTKHRRYNFLTTSPSQMLSIPTELLNPL